MIKLAAISPRTNSFNVQDGDSSPESKQYERLFSEMAHASLGAKSPQLAETIQHFKVISINLDKDSAVGIFICDLGAMKIHIPIVLSMGKIKPPEVFYVPEMDRYIPLTARWLKETTSGRIGELGVPVNTGKMQFSDSSLSQVTSPPTSRNKFSSYDLPVLISRCNNKAKQSLSNFLKTSQHVLRKSIKYHGSDLVSSLQKTAEVESASKKSWVILDSNSSADKFREHFGKYAAQAFQESQIHGMSYLDYRKNAGYLVKKSQVAEKSTALSYPSESGIYKIIKTDGSHLKCLILKSPIPVNSVDRMSEYKYLVVLENGDYLETDKIVAVPTAESVDSDSLLYKRLEGLGKKNGHQILVRYSDGVLHNSSSPVTLTDLTKRSDGVMTARCGSKSIVFNGTSSTIHAPSGESVVFVPPSYNSLSLREKKDCGCYITDISEAASIINNSASKEASRQVSIRRNSIGDWAIDGRSYGSTKEAMFSLATKGCSIKEAHKALSLCSDGNTHNFFVVPKSRVTKLASIFGPDVSQEQQMAPLPPDMSQQQMQMDPQTGLPIDPQSGMPYNPETGGLVDVQTGQELDPETGEPMPTPEEQQIMEEAAKANDQIALDSAMAATILSEANMPELTLEYLPKLETALDSLGRIIITIQMKQDVLSEKIGLEEYSRLENSLKKVSTGLGDIILRLKNASTVAEEARHGEDY
jgi:hypothetical protein